MEYIDLRKIPDEEYKEAMDDMMATKGWHFFCSELFALSETLNNVQDIPSMEKLFEVRGQLNTIGFVLNYQEIMNTTRTPDASPV